MSVVGEEGTAAPGARYHLFEHGHGIDLGTIDHDDPSLQAGDHIALPDGRVVAIVTRVNAPRGSTVTAILGVFVFGTLER